MLFDLSLFLIISIEDFNSLITKLGCNLTINDSCYMVTYLFANFMAYFLIVFITWLVIYLISKLFSTKGGIF